jgi:hypothetical protein
MAVIPRNKPLVLTGEVAAKFLKKTKTNELKTQELLNKKLGTDKKMDFSGSKKVVNEWQ